MKTGMKKWLFLSFVLTMLTVFTVACGATEEKATDEKDKATETKTAEEGKGDTAFPVTVVDGTGEEVTIETEPETIVSVIPSNTEITFALGQGDKLIGVDNYSNYPPEVEKIEKIGDQQLNVEKILALKPDLALVTDFQHENNPDILKKFKDAGINVIVISSAESFENVYNTIQLIGQVTGAADEADKVVKEMKDSLAEIKEKAKAVTEKKKVWVEVSPAPDIFTTGQNTFMHEMLQAINAENVAGEQNGWVKMTEEEIVTLNPDVIITTYGYYVENPEEQVLNRAGWKEVPAIQNKQVYDVNNDTVTRPGPRLIDGVETLAKLVYPEVFGK
ncbi:ABC transporter substrate-binding protein [uncultured Metabacillus sp.]